MASRCKITFNIEHPYSTNLSNLPLDLKKKTHMSIWIVATSCNLWNLL
jgi:hypothetical protein